MRAALAAHRSLEEAIMGGRFVWTEMVSGGKTIVARREVVSQIGRLFDGGRLMCCDEFIEFGEQFSVFFFMGGMYFFRYNNWRI